jgi:LruC domain-containing protein
VEHVKEFYCHAGSNETLVKETFNITSDHSYITQENSFGVRLNTKAKIATIYANKAKTGTAPDPSAASKADSKLYYCHPNFTFVKSSTNEKNGIYYYYFNDLYNYDRGKTTYSIEVTYASSQTDSKASIQLFLCRNEGSSYREIHVPFEAPGPKVITKYFGTEDDCSDHANKKNYYTSDGKYPFGFYLAGVRLDEFRTTLLDPAKESIRIDEQFPTFLSWVNSNGQTNDDWYLHPNPDAKKPE